MRNSDARLAVLIGGPRDGEGMWVGDQPPAYLLFPVKEPITFEMGYETRLPDRVPHLRISRYYREQVQWAMETRTILYTYSGDS